MGDSWFGTRSRGDKYEEFGIILQIKKHSEILICVAGWEFHYQLNNYV